LGRVILSSRARKDLQEFVRFYLEWADEEIAQRNKNRLMTELKHLSDNPLMSGSPIEGLSAQYRSWLVLDGKYRIYFKRPTPKTIRIIMLRSTKQRPISPNEIMDADT
jgi:plasmid stabilization system protein ParE